MLSCINLRFSSQSPRKLIGPPTTMNKKRRLDEAPVMLRLSRKVLPFHSAICFSCWAAILLLTASNPCCDAKILCFWARYFLYAMLGSHSWKLCKCYLQMTFECKERHAMFGQARHKPDQTRNCSAVICEKLQRTCLFFSCVPIFLL